MGRHAGSEYRKWYSARQPGDRREPQTDNPLACKEDCVRRLLASISILLVLFSAAAPAAAGSLNLTITDPQGAVVSGARVIVYSPEGDHVLATATTGADGVASFLLPGASYRVEVLAPTFAAYLGA